MTRRAATGARRTLILAAHGTRDPDGLAASAGVADRIRILRPELDVRLGYVDVAEPAIGATLPDASQDAVLVPLMLGTGYHVRVDIPRAVAGRGTAVTPALGPDPLLVGAMLDRLAAIDVTARLLTPEDTVILAAAGSSDPRSCDEARIAARRLGDRLRTPVRTAFVSAATPPLPEAVAEARRVCRGRVIVATYLLAPGYFARAVAAADADLVAEPLGTHPAVAAVALARFDAAGRQLSDSRSGSRIQDLGGSRTRRPEHASAWSC